MRSDNWEHKLQEYIDKYRQTPLEFGKHDCCTFTIEWEKVLTGKSTFPEFDRTFKSLEQGKEILKKVGFKNWVTIVNSRLERIQPIQARRGDLVSMKFQGAYCMGICLGKMCAFVGYDKMEFISKDQMKYAWRFG